MFARQTRFNHVLSTSSRKSHDLKTSPPLQHSSTSPILSPSSTTSKIQSHLHQYLSFSLPSTNRMDILLDPIDIRCNNNQVEVQLDVTNECQEHAAEVSITTGRYNFLRIDQKLAKFYLLQPKEKKTIIIQAFGVDVLLNGTYNCYYIFYYFLFKL